MLFGENTEAQRDEAACSRLHGHAVAKPRLEPKLPSLDSLPPPP